MRKPFAIAAALALCAAPALAGVDRQGRDCDRDPETTSALSADPRSLYPPGERPGRDADRVEMTPPEESWQKAAQENAERRRRDILACGVD